MRKMWLVPAVAAAMLGLSACDVVEFGDMGRFSRDVHYSYPLHAGGRLNVETFNGAIEISAWDQDTVDISGTKYGPTQEAADDLKVTVENSADAVSVRVTRPFERRNHLGARFVIKVPRGAVLERITTSNGSIRTNDGNGPARLRTSNGAVHVLKLQGNVDIQTSNGSIEVVDVNGDVVAHTSNGRIRADRLNGSLDATSSNGGVHADLAGGDRAVRVETSNGSVDLSLPANSRRDIRVSTNNAGITVRLASQANARILARTSNSSITTDFDVKMQGEFSKNHMDATIGSGGPLIDLTTSNGGIRLLRM